MKKTLKIILIICIALILTNTISYAGDGFVETDYTMLTKGNTDNIRNIFVLIIILAVIVTVGIIFRKKKVSKIILILSIIPILLILNIMKDNYKSTNSQKIYIEENRDNYVNQSTNIYCYPIEENTVQEVGGRSCNIVKIDDEGVLIEYIYGRTFEETIIQKKMKWGITYEMEYAQLMPSPYNTYYVRFEK